MDSAKQSLGSVLKVLAESLKSIFDEVHFIVNLHSFHLPPALFRQSCPPRIQTFVPHPPRQNNFQNFPPSRHISNSLSVYLFLSFEL